MKAVRQIIDYLRDRGLLSCEQLRTLSESGFLESPETETEEREPVVRATEEFWPEDDEPPPIRPRADPSRRGRASVSRRSDSGLRLLGDRLDALSEEWAAELDALLGVARRLEPCVDWHDAALVIRNADADELFRALVASIVERSPTLEEIWKALALESYREVLDEPGAHGWAPGSFRAILAAAEGTHLRHRSALLTDERVCKVVNLRSAQRRLLRGFGVIFDEKPTVFDTALRRERSGLAYWPLVLVYSASRGESGSRPRPDSGERWPPRQLPDEAGWLRAWGHAAAMVPDRVPLFLTEFHAMRARRPAAIRQAIDDGLEQLGRTPNELMEVINRVGYPSAVTPGSGDRPARDVVELAEVLAGLRTRVEEAGLVPIPADAEGTRVWERFLERWLYLAYWLSGDDSGRERGLQNVVHFAFGPTTDLFCPRSWDVRGWF